MNIELEIKGEELKKKLDLKDGKTPVKGVDYFDGKTPVKGVDYFDGQPGEPGQNGKDAEPQVIVPLVVERIIEQKEAILDTPLEVKNKLESLKKDERLDVSAIKGISHLRDRIVKHSVDQARGLLYAGLLENTGRTTSIAKQGSTPLTGAVTLSEGSNITLTQVGQDISIASTGGGTPGGAQYDVQLNDGSSAFIGSSAFSFDYSTGILNVNGGTLNNAVIRTNDNTISFGDINGAGNSTTLVLDDSARTLTFSGSSIIGNLNGNATTATTATNITVSDAASDTTTWVLLAGTQTGNQGALTDAGLSYNASTNALTATTFIGALTGNASTATTLATSRNIWGQAFNGSADVTGSLTAVDDITGGASDMVILAGTGASRTLTLQTTTSGSTATNALVIDNKQSITTNATLVTVTVPAFSGASGTNWTFGTGWTTPITGSTLDKSSDGTGTMTPSGTFTIAVGTTYKVVITTTTSPTTGTFVSNFTYSLGGVVGSTISSATTTTEYITALTTGKIIITPSNTSRFGITSITVQSLTDATADLTVDGNLTVRSPVTFGSDLQLLGTSSAIKIWNGTSYSKMIYGLAASNQVYLGGAGNTVAGATNNFAGGFAALASVTNSAGAEGSFNVAIGFNTMTASTTAHDNMAFGAYSLWQNTSGSSNAAIGSNSMILNTTGNFNVGIGYQALGGSRTSLYNVAIGNQAGNNFTANVTNTNGLNTFIGALAGFGTAGTNFTVTITIASPAVITKTTHGLAASDRVQFSTTGALPTGINAGTTYYVLAAGLTANDFQISLTDGGAAINTSGTQSPTHTCFKIVSTGVQQTFIGAQAGYDFTSGGNHTYVGYNTGRGVTTGTGNTILGAQVTGLAATLTNNIILAIGTGATKLQFDATNWIVTGGAFLPSANDAVVLGAAGTAFSDLFLAEGGVINWDSGDVTITQTGNVLAFAGATTAYTFDAPIRHKNYTVATLPAGTQGDRAYVTDATAPTYLGALVGGGAVVCPVFYNGTAWVSA